MPRRVTSPELVGRADELATLNAALERASDGQARTVLVAGEAGVGKTRLLTEFERRAAQSGARVLRGDCVVLAHGELPFAPLTAALRPVAGELGPAGLATLPGRDDLSRLLPELGDAGAAAIEPPSALEESLAQSRLFETLLGLLSRLGEDAATVLAIEDLHWADRSTRDFLSFLVRNGRDARLLLVCTYRSDELHRRHPLRPFVVELERRGEVQRVDVEALSRDELRALLEGILDESPSDALTDDLFERCDGNPFFAEELLAASGNGRTIPSTLRDALMLRVEALSGQSRELLRPAAAAGRRVSHRLLAELAGLDDAELDDGLRDAVARHVLVQEGETYAFRHALVREAVYSDLLPGERTKLHAALAEALVADPSLAEGMGSAAAAEIASHWWEARRLPEALAASIEAAGAAEQIYAFAEAHRHLENALEIWDEVDDAERLAGTDRAAVLARAAESANLIDELDRAVALGRQALELTDSTGDPVRAALLRERLGRYLWATGRAEEGEQSYCDAVELMPDDRPTAELARVLAAYGQILMLRGRPRESRTLCERAIEVARSAGARAEEGHALDTLGVDLSALGDRSRGIELLREAMRIAEELGLVDELGRCYVNLSEELEWDGRLADGVDLAMEGAAEMRRLGARSFVGYLESEAANRLCRLGRLAEADEVVRRMLEAGSSGMGAVTLGDGHADVALARGEADKAAEGVRWARDALGKTRDSMFFGPTAAIEVELALLRGEPEDAARIFEDALEAMAGQEEYAFSTARLYARGIRAYAELSERAQALDDAALIANAERRAALALERFDAVLAPERYEEGSVARTAVAYRAVAEAEMSRIAGRSDPDAWRAAARYWEQLEMALERVYAEWRAAEALLVADGDRELAAELLGSAAATALGAGAAALVAQVEALARRARVPLPAAAGSGDGEPADELDGALERLGLTQREREVLALVAEGRTNREIGEALFITEKTASVHVSRILAKLDVRSRVEAATTAHRLGLASDGERAGSS